MNVIRFALVLAAVILFIIAALGVSSGRYSVLAAGLACWAASTLTFP